MVLPQVREQVDNRIKSGVMGVVLERMIVEGKRGGNSGMTGLQKNLREQN